MEHPNRFRLTEEHLRLVEALVVEWDGGLGGAPYFSTQRPYRNGGGPSSVLELAGVKARIELREQPDGSRRYTVDPRLERLAQKLHRETFTALQIVLSARSFEPGVYQPIHGDYTRWERVQ